MIDEDSPLLRGLEDGMAEPGASLPAARLSLRDAIAQMPADERAAKQWAMRALDELQEADP